MSVKKCGDCMGENPLCAKCRRARCYRVKLTDATMIFPTGETPKDKQLWREYRQANGFLGGD